jgi:hypothetical protein
MKDQLPISGLVRRTIAVVLAIHGALPTLVGSCFEVFT